MSEHKKGTIYFVDAGPGDPGLITVKGRDYLQICDCIVYDHFAPAEVMAMIPVGTILHYVGERPNRLPLTHDEIVQMLVELAESGQTVVRLKGHDHPELDCQEVRLLKERGVPVEIICCMGGNASRIERPLSCLRVMVTLPPTQAGDVGEKLRELGADPIFYSTTMVEATDDPAGWEKLVTLPPDNLWLIFTGENGVRYFLEKFGKQVGDLRQLAPFKIAAVGHETLFALEQFHLVPDFVPSGLTVDELIHEILRDLNLRGASVVRVRGSMTDDLVEKNLNLAGADVLSLTVFRTYFPDWAPQSKIALLCKPPEAVLFASEPAVEGLYHNLTEDESNQLLSRLKIFSLGPQVSRALRAHGIISFHQAELHTTAGLLAALLDHAGKA